MTKEQLEQYEQEWTANMVKYWQEKMLSLIHI